MSLVEVGAYIRLLCHCWNEGSLPTEPHLLARMCGATKRQIHEMWPAIGPCFKPNGEGRLIHPRLEREREKQLTYRQRQSDKGKASAAMRAALQVNHGSTTVQPRLDSGCPPVALPVEPARKLNSSSSSAICNLQTVVKPDTPPLDERWEQFKAKYPGAGRQGGRMALQFFIDACQSVGFETVMTGLDRYCASKKVREGYVIGMEKWLEKTMWIQEPEPEKTVTDDVAAMQKHLAQIDAERAARGR